MLFEAIDDLYNKLAQAVYWQANLEIQVFRFSREVAYVSKNV